jgi:hypothetical protein
LSGDSELQAMVAALRALPNELRASVPEIAEGVRGVLVANIAAGRSPDGGAWAPKKDGGKPLVNAAAALTVTAQGDVIVATVSGPEAFHHYGTKKDPKRQILPQDGTMPTGIADAFRQGLIKRFDKAMGGG